MGILGFFWKLIGGSSGEDESDQKLFEKNLREFYENIQSKYDQIRRSIREAEEEEENTIIKRKAYEDKYKEEDDEALKKRYASKIAKLEEKLDQYSQQISLYEKLESNFSKTLIDLQILRDMKPPFTDEIAAIIGIFNEKLESEDQLTDELLNMIQDIHEEIGDWLNRLDSSQQRIEQLRKQHQKDREKDIEKVRQRLDEEEHEEEVQEGVQEREIRTEKKQEGSAQGEEIVE